jgi:hypothetical protein
MVARISEPHVAKLAGLCTSLVCLTGSAAAFEVAATTVGPWSWHRVPAFLVMLLLGTYFWRLRSSYLEELRGHRAVLSREDP